MYRGALSSWAPVTSGVPQGSVLGPLLFNLFISDISCNVSTNCLLFADDTLLYHPIFSTHDEITLQSDINAIGRWSESNGMKINIVKGHAHDTIQKNTYSTSLHTAWFRACSHINLQISWSDHQQHPHLERPR